MVEVTRDSNYQLSKKQEGRPDLTFEEKYSNVLVGEQTHRSEDGTETTFCAYQWLVELEGKKERHIAEFGLEALQAGYKEAMSSVVIPDTNERPGIKFASITFFFEKPMSGKRLPTSSTE